MTVKIDHFTTKTHAKVILMGEHAVLRGGKAILLPVLSYPMTFTYKGAETSIFKLNSPKGNWDNSAEIVNLLEKTIGISLPTGHYTFDYSFPLSSGLGGSACLCLSLARFLANQRLISSDKTFDIARELEGQYHSQSSGADIIGVGAKAPTTFQRFPSHHCEEVKVSWPPILFMKHSTIQGQTKEAVEKVLSLKESDPNRFNKLEEIMKKSAQLAIEALQESDETLGLAKLESAFHQATKCFHEWGLIPAPQQTMMDDVFRLGARAVKPTGSGLGGYILSLWDKTPPPEILETWHPIPFNNEGGLS